MHMRRMYVAMAAENATNNAMPSWLIAFFRVAFKDKSTCYFPYYLFLPMFWLLFYLLLRERY